MQEPRKNNKTIVLTGGHAGATAYAFTEALKKDKTFEWAIHFIGSRSAVEGKQVTTLEAKSLPTLGVNYHTITTGRLQMRFTKHTIPSLFKIPVGIFQTLKLLNNIKPDVVLSFGGYAAFPVVLLSKIKGIPILIHEQTSAYGRANKASERFANKVLLSREESVKFFNPKKSLVIGNPVLEATTKISPKLKIGDPVTIFVTGGSRGSEVINENLLNILPKLLLKYKIVHQVGTVGEEKFKRAKENLGDLGKNYEVYGLISPEEWPSFIDQADVVVSRAGANIVSEIIITKRPTLFIPIPWSFADEQTKNALFAKSFGIAKILPQDELTPTNLYEEIEDVISKWNEMIQTSKNKKSPDLLASKKMVEVVIDTLK